MTNTKTMSLWENGWFLASFNILVLWALNNVVVAFCAQTLHANPIIYSCANFTGSALVMLLISGKGPLVKETLRSIDTWVYGIVLILGYILTFKLMAYVSATEGSLLQRTSMIISLLASWFFLSRQPKRTQLQGALLVALGVGWMLHSLPSAVQMNVLLLVLLSGIVQALRVFSTETHRPHNQAMLLPNSLQTRLRVVGFVMLVIGFMFWSLTLMLSLIESRSPGITGLSIVPTLTQFRDPAAIFAGLLMGALLIAPFRLIEFSATAKIKTENYLALSSLAPLATFVWAWMLSPLLKITSVTIHGGTLVWGGALVTAGGIVASYVGLKTAKQKPEAWRSELAYTPQNLEAVADSRELVANTLEHFEGNVQKAAKALAVSPETIHGIITDAEKVLAFSPETLKHVARNYRRHVAMADALTGLLNRGGFMTGLKAAAYEAKTLSLLYIDLDKFKPVNDTYGHKAGDFVLQGVAERLQKLFPKQALATRLGGDEFCVLLLNTSKATAEKRITTVQKEIAKPFSYEGKRIKVTASIGLASYPTDTSTPEDLLVLADKGMYREKKGR